MSTKRPHRSRLSSPFLVLLLLLTTACADKDKDAVDKAPSSSGGESAKPVTPKKPALPPLTKEELVATKGLATTGADYDPVKAKFVAKLGRSIYADRVMQWWAVLEGNACWGTSFEWKDDKVGKVLEPRRLTVKDGFAYETCVVAAARNACFRATGQRSACHKKYPQPDSPDEKRRAAATAGFSITDASPNHGPPTGGTLITVVGKGLDRKLTILFGGEKIDIIEQHPTKLTFKSPAAKPGAIHVAFLVFDNGHKQQLMPFGYLGVWEP